MRPKESSFFNPPNFHPDLARLALRDEYARREDANLVTRYRIIEGFISASRASMPPEVTLSPRSSAPSSSWHESPAYTGDDSSRPSRHSDYWFHARAKENRSPAAVPSPRYTRSLSSVPFLHLVSSRKRKLTPLRFFARLPLRYGT